MEDREQAKMVGLDALHSTDEVPFGIEELFYSRTDARGVILAGNAVFRRVAGYDWTSLIGAPHRIIRHPAMPKAVFRLLWSMINRQEPTVAYVCNRASDGRHYWVLATVLPYGKCHLSVRIKPSSGLLPRVQALYAEVARAEAAGMSIEGSLQLLLDRLKAAGFDSYPAFMRHALTEETAARARALNQPPSAEEVGRIRKGLADVMAGQEKLVGDFERLRILPTNMRILASRLEPMGGPVGAISDIYLMISADIFTKVGAFSQGDRSLCTQMAESFERAIFLLTCAQLQAEVLAHTEPAQLEGSGIDHAAEAEFLTLQGQGYRALSTEALNAAIATAHRIDLASTELRRAMLSLETITVMGRVESARIGGEGMRINATINQLHEGNVVISRILGAINDLAGTITTGIKGIQDHYLTEATSG